MNRRTALRLGGIAFATGLAGCSDDGEGGTPTEQGNGDGTDGTPTETATETTDTGPETLIVTLENGDGDPVWSGISVTVELPGSPSMTHNVVEADLAENGQFSLQNQDRPGEYAITVESEDADTVEEDVTVPEGSEEEVTIVVEGHPGDTPTGTDA